MDKQTLLRIAELAKLKIEENQVEETLADFNKIMSYVDSINELDTSMISEEEVYYFHENRTRKDHAGEVLSREKISEFAPKFENGYIVVPRVIET